MDSLFQITQGIDESIADEMVISCVVGKSAGVVVGRIATRQFLNAVLFATARL